VRQNNTSGFNRLNVSIDMTQAAVIVLSYNSLEETTKPCLESIFAAQNGSDFEVLVVDNASTDNTRDYLRQSQSRHANLKLILNSENKGFAGGNNMGIRAAEADFYVLLNSDTRVTDHWLDKMLAFAAAHSEVGLLGPVSNTVGNEQVIYLPAEDPRSVIQSGCRYASRQEDSWFYTSMLGFFCVMIRKEVFQKIGLLDENFGLGFFEDDDFCLRAMSQGFKLACLEGVFIYHQGSVCFSKWDISDLFRKNRRYYEKKNGCKWRPSFRIGVFLDMLDSTISRVSHASLELTIETIANRLKVMRAFDLECFDHPVHIDSAHPIADNIQNLKLENQILREEIRNLQENIRNLQEEVQIQRCTIAQLESRYRELINRQDWRLLMKINKLPGVATLKRLLRPIISRMLRKV
jgi:GT2 family glycosyltransferase